MKRVYLTARGWAELFELQGEKCAKCEDAEGPFEADHSSLVAFGNEAPPDQILCVTCHKLKTRADRKKIAKANRISGKTKSQWNGDRPKKPWPSRPMSKKSARTRDEILGNSNG